MGLLPYFKWFPKDAETDENWRIMDDSQRGFFMRCLDYSWLNGGLPADPMVRARVLGDKLSYMEKQWAVVGRCFEPSMEDEQRLVNPRQDKERKLAIIKSERATESVRTRYERTYERSTNVVREAQPNVAPRAVARAESESVYESDSVVSCSEEEQNTAEVTVTHQSWKEASFQEFWGIVWAKIGRGDAERAWRKVVKTQEMAGRVIEAAKVQGQLIIGAAAAGQRSVLHPATWLNGGRFDDDVGHLNGSLFNELAPKQDPKMQAIRMAGEMIGRKYGI